MTIRERWIHNVHELVTGDEARRKRIAPVAATVLFGLVALLLVLSLMVDKFIGMAGFISTNAGIALGLPLLLVGLYFMMWSTFTFAESGGTPVPINPPQKLVTAGPYAYVRNPMLAGIFFLLFGIGFLLTSFTIVFVFTPLFVAMNVAEVKAVEEPELEMRLGIAYREYRDHTPMFIPWPWKKQS
ncbi:MAG: isoprenylcysteine carboxylmethyltransferase family protein [Nitrospinota bacterium]|nr:isoprenylcysteine carboxylmethyltransferase family protein [Nitrospinota bacterium]